MAILAVRLLIPTLSAFIALSPAGAENVSPGGALNLNPANEELLKLPPPERAEKLARSISQWCIGTEAFPMGVVGAGPGRGNAYWSLRCTDGTSWAIQIDPEFGVTAIGCDEFAAAAPGIFGCGGELGTVTTCKSWLMNAICHSSSGRSNRT